jgi:hypothetical protein
MSQQKGCMRMKRRRAAAQMLFFSFDKKAVLIHSISVFAPNFNCN